MGIVTQAFNLPVLLRRQQEDLCEFKDSLVYINFQDSQDYIETLSQKEKKKQNKKPKPIFLENRVSLYGPVWPEKSLHNRVCVFNPSTQEAEAGQPGLQS